MRSTIQIDKNVEGWKLTQKNSLNSLSDESVLQNFSLIKNPCLCWLELNPFMSVTILQIYDKAYLQMVNDSSLSVVIALLLSSLGCRLN